MAHFIIGAQLSCMRAWGQCESPLTPAKKKKGKKRKKKKGKKEKKT